ncbi:hypothetical protein TNCV_3854901 [Trichonephila clavipes]|nr:hypothetical protein TNCV_3854901 [Trichonephila clavipes]
MHPALDLFRVLTITMKIKNRNGYNVVALVHPGSMKNVSNERMTPSIVITCTVLQGRPSNMSVLSGVSHGRACRSCMPVLRNLFIAADQSTLDNFTAGR